MKLSIVLLVLFFAGVAMAQQQITPGFIPRTQPILGPTGVGSDGQVLTSDGLGGSAFEDAAGGISIGDTITSATEGSVLFAGTSGILAQDNSNLFWDDTNKWFGIGTATPTAVLDVSGIGTKQTLDDSRVRLQTSGVIYVESNASDAINNAGVVLIVNHSANTLFPFLSARKTRGTKISPTAVQSGDVLMRFGGAGYGTSFPSANNAAIQFIADGTFTGSSWPAYITFETTATSSTSLTERMRVSSGGLIGVNDPTPDAQLDVATSTTGTIGLIIEPGQASQTADLLNINSYGGGGGGDLVKVDSNGYLQSVNFYAPKYVTDDSLFIGDSAGSVDDGSTNHNIGIGYQSLASVTSGYNNTAVGVSSLETLTTGYENCAFGRNSGQNITGNLNFAMGSYSLKDANGNNNVAVGYAALQATPTDSSIDKNVGIGTESMKLIDTGGDGNVAVGYQAGYSVGASDWNVFIGHQAGYNETGSNKLYIENSNSATPLIYGEFDNDHITINGSFAGGVGGDDTQANDSTIDVTGHKIIRVVGNGGAVVLDTDPAIEDGAADGQEIVIQGTSDVNTVAIANGVNTSHADGIGRVLGQGDTIHYVWDSGDSVWYEVKSEPLAGDVQFSDLAAGDTYTNFGTATDDTIDELFAAVDTQVAGVDNRGVNASPDSQADDSTIDTTDHKVVRVQCNGSDSLLDTDPAIEDGVADGDMLTIHMVDPTYTLTIADGANTVMAGNFAMDLQDTITFYWDDGQDLWIELCRSAN